jgi:phosphoribosylglycinamide formyltransferase-1
MADYGWRSDYTWVYQARMSNSHPGPLPETADTYGLGGSERVLALGLASSKHTLHLVAPGVDTGPVLAVHPVEVHDGDSAQDLFDRVQVVEKAALPYALDRFLREQEEYVRYS